MGFNTLIQDTLHELFDYCPEGQLVWKVTNSNRAVKGTIAGWEQGSGYRCVTLNKVKYPLSRVIWTYHHGEIPDGFEVDHFDLDPSNNRIDNLRLLDRSDNAKAKTVKPQTNNKSGYTGVRQDKRNGSWIAQIKPKGEKTKHLGCFKTFEEAVAARKAAEDQYGFTVIHNKVAK